MQLLLQGSRGAYRSSTNKVGKRRWLSSRKCSDGATNAQDAAIATSLRNSLRKTIPPGMFPWRHEAKPLDRFIPGTRDFQEKGDLLGENIISGKGDETITALVFLRAPLHKVLFFNHWKTDLADSISWAFTRGVAGMLSNVYCEHQVDFGNPLPGLKENEGTNKEKVEGVENMMERRLISMYRNAHLSGRDQIRIRLETKPLASTVSSLFCFPFLSRYRLERDPSFKESYLRFLHQIKGDFREALLGPEVLAEFQKFGKIDSTVICQVMMSCDETFWVKDLATGAIIQGKEGGPRRVWHLVRMEMVVEMHPGKGRIWPIEMIPGNWQITDIDDMLGGNLIL